MARLRPPNSAAGSLAKPRHRNQAKPRQVTLPSYNPHALRYREFRPSAPLRPFVNTFWILEHNGDAALPQRIVPDGHPELILNWGTPFESLRDGKWRLQSRCFFAGQIDSPLMLRPKGPAKMLGIGFHPDGAAGIFAEPMHELGGRFTPIEDLSTGLSRNLENALESPDPIAAVESALLSVVGSSTRRDQLIGEAVRRLTVARGSSDIAVLARELGLSTRQFERRFSAAVGLPPKVFSRIQRFTNVFRALERPSCDWVEIALACGYYDQAHLIRDCKSFSGCTPAILLSEHADLARHFYRRFGMSHSSNTGRGALV
jgi:AraC-like DNA-binding protein